VLADLGADVLKVERPRSATTPAAGGPPFHGDDAAYFLLVNRDRRSLALDLTTDAGRAVVAPAGRAADVVCRELPAAAPASARLEPLRASAEAVWVSVRGAGGDGPDADKPGYDVMAQARSGLMSVTGTTEPTKVGVAVADVVTGLYGAVGALAGLLARGRASGAGGPLRVEVGLLEAAVSMLVNQAANALVGGVVPTYAGNDHPNIAPYGPVPCADRPLVVGAGNDAQFAQLCGAIGLVPEPAWATNSGRVPTACGSARRSPSLRRRPRRRGPDALGAVGAVPPRCRTSGRSPTTRRCQGHRVSCSVGSRTPPATVRWRSALPTGSTASARACARTPAARPAHPEGLAALGLTPAHLVEVTGADRR
jgi:hypothetical protein